MTDRMSQTRWHIPKADFSYTNCVEFDSAGEIEL